jgi:hypothetical protein
MDYMEALKNIAAAVFPVAYFLLGLYQLGATYAGLSEWLGWHWIIAAPLSAILAYFPLLGTISGVMGAHYGWHWGWGASFALFFGPMLLILFLGLLFSRRD